MKVTPEQLRRDSAREARLHNLPAARALDEAADHVQALELRLLRVEMYTRHTVDTMDTVRAKVSEIARGKQ